VKSFAIKKPGNQKSTASW